MACYAIFRHGSNAANQTMTQIMCVAAVEATTRQNAILAARAEGVDCYNNQHLEAKPYSLLNAEETEELNDLIRDKYSD